MHAHVERWSTAALAAARASPETQRSDLVPAIEMLVANVQREIAGLTTEEPRAVRQPQLREILDALDAVTLSLGGALGDRKVTAELHAATQALLTSLEPYADAPTKTRA